MFRTINIYQSDRRSFPATALACIGLMMFGFAGACFGFQSSNGASLKQTRDPYFNPKLQGDWDAGTGLKSKVVTNPSFVSGNGSPSATFPAQNGTPPPSTSDTPLPLPTGWLSPSSPPSSILMMKNEATPFTLPLHPSAEPLSQPKGLETLSGSIIRTSPQPSASQKPPEIVADFSADLSQLRRPPSDSSAPPPASSTSPSATATPLTLNPPRRDEVSATKAVEPTAVQEVPVATTPVAPEKPTMRPTGNPDLEPTRLLAMVGSEPIFVGDLLFELNQMIERHMANAPETFKERERANGIKMLLNKYIDAKILYVDTLRKLPEGADVNKIIEQAGQEFDKSVAPTMMKSAGVESVNDFDAFLRVQGGSLRKVRLAWCQDQITRYFVSQELEVDKEITHRELLEEYQRRMPQYAVPAKARWEQITVRFDRTATRAEAEALIVEMGNKIVYGANFASVAKKGSHGFTAANGGLHDWTAKGELASQELDEALFSEPVGRLSDKIFTAEGIHIIRVLERTEATHTPFIEAQVEIKQDLQDRKRAEAFEKHLAKLKKEIPVVLYDIDGTPVARVADAGAR